MMKYIIATIFAFTTVQSCAQIDRKPDSSNSIKNNNAVEYRLFSTQNMWTFIKLNTRNGRMWQVQFSTKEENRFATNLSSVSLVSKEEEENDRFTLYPTTNIYTFILLDQIDGRTWQVQWSIEPKNRLVLPIE